jgi:hypothetical protein
VARQNEYAISISAGLALLTGIGKKTVGGSFALGINIGFNRDEKHMVFEFFTEVDRMDRALTPMFMVGLSPKIGFMLKEQKRGKEMIMRQGYTFYPPAFPLYSTTSAQMVSMGINSALLTFPSILGDAFSYINKTWRQPLLRIVISPVMKGIFRVQVPGYEKDGPLFQTVSNLKHEILSRIRSLRFKKPGQSQKESCDEALSHTSDSDAA